MYVTVRHSVEPKHLPKQNNFSTSKSCSLCNSLCLFIVRLRGLIFWQSPTVCECNSIQTKVSLRKQVTVEILNPYHHQTLRLGLTNLQSSEEQTKDLKKHTLNVCIALHHLWLSIEKLITVRWRLLICYMGYSRVQSTNLTTISSLALAYDSPPHRNTKTNLQAFTGRLLSSFLAENIWGWFPPL